MNYLIVQINFWQKKDKSDWLELRADCLITKIWKENSTICFNFQLLRLWDHYLWKIKKSDMNHFNIKMFFFSVVLVVASQLVDVDGTNSESYDVITNHWHVVMKKELEETEAKRVAKRNGFSYVSPVCSSSISW